MNITKTKINYILGNTAKTFKIPKEDQHINFKKWSYNDVIEYIKLTEKKKENKPSKKSKVNKIKYQKLITVKDNPIIKGKKTVDQLRNEYLLAVNNYGNNSTEARTILEQLTDYGTKILKAYYQDYLKQIQTNSDSDSNLTIQEFTFKLNEAAKKYILDVQSYRIKNDNSSGMNIFEKGIVNYSKNYNFIDLLGYSEKLFNNFNDSEKIYFKFPISNNYTVDEAIEQLKKYIDDDIRKFNKFYNWEEENCVIDKSNIGDKKDELIKDNKFPIILTDIHSYQIIYICSDILEFIMSKDNGKLRKTIYYCQYDNDLLNRYFIMNNDILDIAFIDYFMKFMNNSIIFEGENIEIAFLNKFINKIYLSIGINITNYKNVYDNKIDNNIKGTNMKNKLTLDDYKHKMEEDDDDKNKDTIKAINDRINKKIEENKNKREKIEDFTYPYPLKPKKNIKILSSNSEDIDSNDLSIDDDIEKEEEEIDVPKPTEPIITTEEIKPIETIEENEMITQPEIKPIIIKDDDKDIKPIYPPPNLPPGVTQPTGIPQPPIPNSNNLTKDFEDVKPIPDDLIKEVKIDDKLLHKYDDKYDFTFYIICNKDTNTPFPEVYGIVVKNNNKDSMFERISKDDMNKKSQLYITLMNCETRYNKLVNGDYENAEKYRKPKYYYSHTIENIKINIEDEGTKFNFVYDEYDDLEECKKYI